MIKPPLQPNVKSKSREKLKPRPNNSRSKLETHPNKTVQLERHIINQSKSKQRSLKSGKKLKIEQSKPQVTTLKLKNENKQQSDSYGLYMKADLKHLISKNNTTKSKNADIVPELIKNIQKNCKALKSIRHKQSQISEKRSSQHSNKIQTSKRKSIQYKKSDQRSKIKQSLQKDPTSNEANYPKITRFSLEISQGDTEKVKIEQKLRQNQARKSTQDNDKHKNFVELFKVYKKSFQIEDFKIEKSNRKTNYNTNQSRNSSSHVNSHGQSRVGDYNNRGKSREDEKLNIEKIENLIKSQQKQVEKENEDCNQLQIDTVRNKIEIIRSQKLLNNDASEINEIRVNQSLKQEKFINFSDNFVIDSLNKADLDSNQGPKLTRNEKQLENAERNLERESQIQEKQVQQPKEAQFQSQNGLLIQKKFEQSKFYVQPIPKFESKKRQTSQEDLSLLGCQITLIQNNILMEDSEIVSLQL